MQPVSMKRKSVARKKGRARGIDIREQVAHEQSSLEAELVPVSKGRLKAFENRECIGE